MANPNQMFTQINQDINALITVLRNLQTDQEMINDDNTLAAAIASQAVQRGWTVTTTDVTNAVDAITQMLFTFNSGSPTTASKLYKLK